MITIQQPTHEIAPPSSVEKTKETMKLKSLSYAFVLISSLLSPAHADVGFSQFTLPTNPSVPVAIWYPSDEIAGPIDRGPFSFSAAENAAPRKGQHPLVIISHGAGSGMFTHVNLAAALANAGYIVVAPTHTNDNFRDDSGSGTASVIKSRAKTITRLIDRITSPNPLNLQVDTKRISVAGFSAGGTTALALAGAIPVMAAALTHCAASNDPFCRFIDPDDPRFDDTTPLSNLHDARIQSFVLMAPVTAYFTEPELKKLSQPLFIFAPGRDTELSAQLNAARLRPHISPESRYLENPDAGHFSILPVFPQAVRDQVPEALTTDSEGFDREAFHKELFGQIVAFLNAQSGQ